jgi:hypothetical protein
MTPRSFWKRKSNHRMLRALATTEPAWKRCTTRCFSKTYFRKLTVCRKNPTINSWYLRSWADTIVASVQSLTLQRQGLSKLLRLSRYRYRTSTVETLSSSRIRPNNRTSRKILDSPSSRTRATSRDSLGTRMDNTVRRYRGSSCSERAKFLRMIARAMMKQSLPKNRGLMLLHGNLRYRRDRCKRTRNL